MDRQRLIDQWERYNNGSIFNYSSIRDKAEGRYPLVNFSANDPIVERGAFPEYVYFILAGSVIGARHYEDGNEYDYFQLDSSNASIGLLEVLAQREKIIATILCTTNVKTIRIPSEVVYEWVMQDIHLLRLSTRLLARDLYRSSGNDGLFYYFGGVDRLRYYLKTCYEEGSSKGTRIVRVCENREQIAHKLGLSVRTVGRALKMLKDSGELMNVNRRICIGPEEYMALQRKFSYRI